MIKKILSYILISVIISVNLFAPISVELGKKNDLKITTNKVEAANENCEITKVEYSPATTIANDKPAATKLTVTTTDCVGTQISGAIKQDKLLSENMITLSAYEIKAPGIATFIVTPGENKCGDGVCETKLILSISVMNSATELATYKSNGTNDKLAFKCSTATCNEALTWTIVPVEGAQTINATNKFSIIPSVTSNSITVSGDGPNIVFANDNTLTVELHKLDGTLLDSKVYNINTELKQGNVISYSTTFSGLEPAVGYNVILRATGLGEEQMSGIVTLNAAGQTVVALPGAIDTKGVTSSDTGMPPCGILTGSLMGCVAQGFYYVLFVPTSYMFALAGVFFDNTFAYSVQDTSYRSGFVVQGWGLVRDFCNIFFIFILLYIAIGTVLSLHSVKTKEMIINVVIIGLFINFSLFATQIIIDASNIMARVFYNSDTIKVTQKDGAKLQNESSTGVISLSAGLVDKVNPQNIIINSKEISTIPTKGGDVQDADKSNMGIGQFILVVLLAVGVNLVGIVVFASVGLIFVARVIGLWLAMIFAPIAFLSYTIPQMQDIEMVGWKKWWPETIKLAFLAPVFIFFMYIILGFLELDLVSDAAGKSGLDFLIATIIPFAFIMILLWKAKSIATDMSGTIGKQITSGLAVAGGLALGAATGGAAMMGRATVGRLGSVISKSETLKKMEAKGTFGAKTLRNIGSTAAKGSFDARGAKIGGKGLSDLGVKGKAKEGGFDKMRADKTIERQKRAKELEVGPDSKMQLDVREKEATLKRMQDANSQPIHDIDGKLVAARQKKADSKAGSIEEQAAIDDIARLSAKKSKINAGGAITTEDEEGKIVNEKNADGTNKYLTDNGKISKTELDNAKTAETESAAEVITAQAEVTTAQAAIKAIEDEVKSVSSAAEMALTTETTAINTERDAKLASIDAQMAISELAAPDDATKFTVRENTRKEKEAVAEKASESIKNAEKTKTQKIQAVESKLTPAKENEDKANKKVTAATTKAVEMSSKAAVARADAVGGTGTSINELQYHDLPHAQHLVTKENNERKNDYAEVIQSKFNKVANFIESGGQHSSLGANEAAHKIRMDVKVESSGGHGDGGGHAAPAAHAPAAKTEKPAESHAPAAGGGGHH